MQIEVERYPMQGGGYVQKEGAGYIHPNASKQHLSVKGSIVAGRGWSTVDIKIPPDCFRELVEAMLSVNAEAAIRAVGAALATYKSDRKE